jgi:hypothetical protein
VCCERLVNGVKLPFVFSYVEYCDMHFVYGVCNGSGRAAVLEYQRRFPDRRIPSRHVFTRVHQTLRETRYLPSVAVRSEREGYEHTGGNSSYGSEKSTPFDT